MRRTDLLVALGIALHNLPEGLAIGSGHRTGDGSRRGGSLRRLGHEPDAEPTLGVAVGGVVTLLLH